MNSETARAKVEHWQSQGQFGARDFDKVIFNLPIPEFNKDDNLHRALAAATVRAEKLAATVPLKVGMHFASARKAIRKALDAEGVANEIDTLVARLLP